MENDSSECDKIALNFTVINSIGNNYGNINVGELPLQLEDRRCKETLFTNNFHGDNNGNIIVGNRNSSCLTNNRNCSFWPKAANGNVCEKTERVYSDEELSDTELGFVNEGFMDDKDLSVASKDAYVEADISKTTFHCTINDGTNKGTIVIGERNKICVRDCHECAQNSCASSDEEIVSSSERNRIALLHSQMPCSDEKEFRSILKKYRSRTNKLRFLRDYGQYELLDEKITQLIGKEDAVDKVIGLVETSITLSHRKELAKSKTTVQQAIELIPQSNPSASSVLTALCYLVLASVNRREGELVTALNFIDIALQLIATLPVSELNGYVIYERGSILALQASMKTAEDNGLKLDNAAEDHLRQAVSIFEAPNIKKGLYSRKNIFAFCKLAQTKLKCESADDHNNSVTDVSIRDAWNSIKTVAKVHIHETPPAARIQLKIAKSDYYYRIGRYKKSKKRSSAAMAMARELLMKLELSRIQRRLDAINACLQRPTGNF